MTKKSKKPQIKAIIFDIGGVQYFYDHTRAAKLMSKYLGISASKIYKVLTMHSNKPGFTRMAELGAPEKEYWPEFAKKLGIKKANHKKLTALWNKIFYPNKPLLKLIPQLKKNYMLGILSNMDIGNKKYLISKFNVTKPFGKGKIVWSCDVKTRKPEKKIYQIVIKKAKVNPSEILFVDDLKRNIEMAKKIGAYGIVYKNHKNFLKKLQKLVVKW